MSGLTRAGIEALRQRTTTDAWHWIGDEPAILVHRRHLVALLAWAEQADAAMGAVLDLEAPVDSLRAARLPEGDQ